MGTKREAGEGVAEEAQASESEVHRRQAWKTKGWGCREVLREAGNPGRAGLVSWHKKSSR